MHTGHVAMSLGLRCPAMSWQRKRRTPTRTATVFIEPPEVSSGGFLLGIALESPHASRVHSHEIACSVLLRQIDSAVTDSATIRRVRFVCRNHFAPSPLSARLQRRTGFCVSGVGSLFSVILWV
jgi:hypothetical protein